MRGAGIIRSAVSVLLMALVAPWMAACGPLSVEDERRLGVDFERDFERRAELVRHPAVTRYVSAIGARLLAHEGPQPFAYRFKVVAGAEVNAFAAPAGRIYLYAGMILKARNVSELAGVIAHEIGHVARRHVAHNFNRAVATQIVQQVGAAAAEAAGGAGAGQFTAAMGEPAATGYLNRFSREAEREADAIAVGLMHRARYDPRGLVSFFETLRGEEGRSAPDFLSSHPATADRIARTRALIERLPPVGSLEVEDGGGLRRIQRILRAVAGRRPR